MIKITDIYFRRPVLYDYIVCVLIILVFYCIIAKFDLRIPSDDKIVDLGGDIGSIGLTISGFILTLLTILVTLKDNEQSDDSPITKKAAPIRIYFNSPLYFKSVKLLRNAVISLVIVSLVIYLVKMLVNNDWIEILFYLNTSGLVIICTTFFRSLYVLSALVKLQKQNHSTSK